MRFDETTRTVAARAVARGLVGWIAFRFTLAVLWLGLDVTPITMDVDVEARLTRYASLRGVVDDREIVGYITSLPPGDSDVFTGQLLARYALTPLIVVASSDYRLVIADFADDEALTAYVGTQQGLVRAHPRPGLAMVERPTGAR